MMTYTTREDAKLLSTLTHSMPNEKCKKAKSSRKTLVRRRFRVRPAFSVTQADPCKQEKRYEHDRVNADILFRSHRKRYRFE